MEPPPSLIVIMLYNDIEKATSVFAAWCILALFLSLKNKNNNFTDMTKSFNLTHLILTHLRLPFVSSYKLPI